MARPHKKDQYQELADFLAENPHIDEIIEQTKSKTITLKRNLQRLGEITSQTPTITL